MLQSDASLPVGSGGAWPAAGSAVFEMSLKAYLLTLMKLKGYIAGAVTEFTKPPGDGAERRPSNRNRNISCYRGVVRMASAKGVTPELHRNLF